MKRLSRNVAVLATGTVILPVGNADHLRRYGSQRYHITCIPSIQVPEAKPVQTQRETIIDIRDPSTIQHLRVMDPRNLKAHVERAITQSRNENIVNIKILPSNQLKSGDLSIKTATGNEVGALKQFTNDWVHRINRRVTVRIPTYGVIAHSIRTSTMDMAKFEETRYQILCDNIPFIPKAEIKYVGWLTRNALTKMAPSTIIEFTDQKMPTRSPTKA